MPTDAQIEAFAAEFITMERTPEGDYMLRARFGDAELGMMVRDERDPTYTRMALLYACRNMMFRLFEEAGV